VAHLLPPVDTEALVLLTFSAAVRVKLSVPGKRASKPIKKKLENPSEVAQSPGKNLAN
jgi:hypothetical protein